MTIADLRTTDEVGPTDGYVPDGRGET